MMVPWHEKDKRKRARDYLQQSEGANILLRRNKMWLSVIILLHFVWIRRTNLPSHAPAHAAVPNKQNRAVWRLPGWCMWLPHRARATGCKHGAGQTMHVHSLLHTLETKHTQIMCHTQQLGSTPMALLWNSVTSFRNLDRSIKRHQN